MNNFIIKKSYPDDIQKILKMLRQRGVHNYDDLVKFFKNYDYLRDYNMTRELDIFYGRRNY